MNVKLSLVVVTLLLGAGYNLIWAPQIFTPRPPIFSGPDIAQNWEWRSHAMGMHSWWLWFHFPDATVRNVGVVSVPDITDPALTGMEFAQGIDRFTGLKVDTSRPPVDITGLNLRDDLLEEAKLYSRIDCRIPGISGEDTCFYFVAWNDSLLQDMSPEFIGVLTNFEKDPLKDSEYGLIERRFLEQSVNLPVDDLPTVLGGDTR